MVELYKNTGIASFYEPGADNSYGDKSNGGTDTYSGKPYYGEQGVCATPWRNEIKRLREVLTDKVDPNTAAIGDVILVLKNGKPEEVTVSQDVGGLEIPFYSSNAKRGQQSADIDLSPGTIQRIPGMKVVGDGLEGREGIQLVVLGSVLSKANLTPEKQKELLARVEELEKEAESYGRYPIYRPSEQQFGTQVDASGRRMAISSKEAESFNSRFDAIRNEVYGVPSPEKLAAAQKVAIAVSNGEASLDALKPVLGTEIASTYLTDKKVEETLVAVNDLAPLPPTQGEGYAAYQPGTMTASTAQARLRTGLSPREDGESVESYKQREQDHMFAMLRDMNLDPMLMGLVMMFLVAAGVVTPEEADRFFAQSHNESRNDPSYDGRYASAHDSYQKAAGYSDANKSYEPYTRGEPVKVPAEQMLRDYTINGGVQIVRGGQFVHNPNNIFARYGVELCDKAVAARKSIPDDAPGVTLSIPHFYTNGTQGARLSNGLWEHERGAFKADIKIDMLSKAGFKTFMLQENVIGQLEAMAVNGNATSLLNHPIQDKANQCDSNFAQCNEQHIAMEDHFNAVDNRSARGYELIVGKGASQNELDIANRVVGENKRHTDAVLRPTPIFSGAYGLPNGSKSIVMITEAGFASNPEDEKLLASPEACYKEAYADCMATIKFGLSKGWKLNDCEMTRAAIKEMVENEKADEKTLLACLRPKPVENYQISGATLPPPPVSQAPVIPAPIEAPAEPKQSSVNGKLTIPTELQDAVEQYKAAKNLNPTPESLDAKTLPKVQNEASVSPDKSSSPSLAC